MSKPPPPEILLSELRETVRVIRENLLRQEALLEQVMVAFENGSQTRVYPGQALRKAPLHGIQLKMVRS